jgi:hypothetical protein
MGAGLSSAPPEPSGPQGPQNANKNAMKSVATPEIKAEYDRLSRERNALGENANSLTRKEGLKAQTAAMEQKYSGLTASGGRSRKRKRKRRKSVRR